MIYTWLIVFLICVYIFPRFTYDEEASDSTNCENFSLTTFLCAIWPICLVMFLFILFFAILGSTAMFITIPKLRPKIKKEIKLTLNELGGYINKVLDNE